jgi:hypothetical protein
VHFRLGPHITIPCLNFLRHSHPHHYFSLSKTRLRPRASTRHLRSHLFDFFLLHLTFKISVEDHPKQCLNVFPHARNSSRLSPEQCGLPHDDLERRRRPLDVASPYARAESGPHVSVSTTPHVHGKSSSVSSATRFDVSRNAIPSLSSTACHQICASVCVSKVFFPFVYLDLDCIPSCLLFFASDLYPLFLYFLRLGLYSLSFLCPPSRLCIASMRLGSVYPAVGEIAFSCLPYSFSYIALDLYPVLSL